MPCLPLCDSRDDFLRAFSGGGRAGFDRAYIPLGCDMRWFTTEEVCEIFSRFEKVIVIGDSMMRHVVGALNVLLRKDLGYGAVTNWNFNDQELWDSRWAINLNLANAILQERLLLQPSNGREILLCPRHLLYLLRPGTRSVKPGLSIFPIGRSRHRNDAKVPSRFRRSCSLQEPTVSDETTQTLRIYLRPRSVE